MRVDPGELALCECCESSGLARTLRLRNFNLYVRVNSASSDSKNTAATESAIREHAGVNGGDSGPFSY